ncbi:MAG TPA: hypothetical protein VMW91_00555 [Desulfosporosinus sp.]|nr:hypothetical protein [Desulfosporosinus sp.]
MVCKWVKDPFAHKNMLMRDLLKEFMVTGLKIMGIIYFGAVQIIRCLILTVIAGSNK